MVVAVTLQVTPAPVVALKPVAGAQVKVEAPVAVMEVLAPKQMVEDPAVTVGTGIAWTVMSCVAVPVHPAVVPLTVYVIVEAALLLTVEPVVVFRAVDGAHV